MIVDKVGPPLSMFPLFLSFTIYLLVLRKVLSEQPREKVSLMSHIMKGTGKLYF